MTLLNIRDETVVKIWNINSEIIMESELYEGVTEKCNEQQYVSNILKGIQLM